MLYAVVLHHSQCCTIHQETQPLFSPLMTVLINFHVTLLYITNLKIASEIQLNYSTTFRSYFLQISSLQFIQRHILFLRN